MNKVSKVIHNKKGEINAIVLDLDIQIIPNQEETIQKALKQSLDGEKRFVISCPCEPKAWNGWSNIDYYLLKDDSYLYSKRGSSLVCVCENGKIVK